MAQNCSSHKWKNMKKITLEGLPFLIGTQESIVTYLLSLLQNKKHCVILPTSLNDLAALESNPQLRKVYRNITYCVTDGMPLVWYFNILLFFSKDNLRIERMYGPTLMKEILTRGNRNTTHFLYGSSTKTLSALKNNVLSFAPQTTFVGVKSPPFNRLSLQEEAQEIVKIILAKPDVLWIGVSSPKQVFIATRITRFLPNTAIFCVGAAFDLLAETKTMAPSSLQKVGLEWLFRLLTEPKRLWQRYLISIPLYLLKKIYSLFSI